MKTGKKLLAMLLCLCLISAMFPSAFAISATHDMTKAACEGLDAAGIRYTLEGLSDDGRREYMDITYGGDNLEEISLWISFDSKYNNIAIYCFGFMTYDPADFTKVLRTCNSLNNENMFVVYTCDEETNEVDAAITTFAPTYAIGDILVELIDSMASIVDFDYETFSVYAR